MINPYQSPKHTEDDGEGLSFIDKSIMAADTVIALIVCFVFFIPVTYIALTPLPKQKIVNSLLILNYAILLFISISVYLKG